MKKATQENDAGLDRSSVVSESLALSNGSGESDPAPPEQPLIDVNYEPGTEEFSYGRSRGEGGELLEWFTVVAEYQYRRQLAKLHNAICCVAGNLDDVIDDPALGRLRSDQFYTAFGIYHFDRMQPELGSRATAGSSETPFNSFLEELPWRLVDEYTSDEPEWLAIANRRAANAVLELSTPALEQNNQQTARRTTSNPPGAGPVRKIARWIRMTNRLPTIADTEEEHASPPGNEGQVDVDLAAGHKRKESRGRGDTAPGNADVMSPSILRRMRQSYESTGSESFMTAIGDETGEAPSKDFEDESFKNSDSFWTACTTAERTEESFRTAGATVRSNEESLFSSPGCLDEDSFVQGGMRRQKNERSVSLRESCSSLEVESSGPTDSADSLPQVSRQLRSVPRPAMPTRGISEETEQTELHSNRNVSLPHVEHSPRGAGGTAENRLARMENIMEQLLIFSSEQALHNLGARSAAVLPDPSNQSLVEEIASLQLQLKRQNEADKEAHHEIEKLRGEVSKLTKIVMDHQPADSQRSSPVRTAGGDLVSQPDDRLTGMSKIGEQVGEDDILSD